VKYPIQRLLAYSVRLEFCLISLGKVPCVSLLRSSSHGDEKMHYKMFNLPDIYSFVFDIGTPAVPLPHLAPLSRCLTLRTRTVKYSCTVIILRTLFRQRRRGPNFEHRLLIAECMLHIYTSICNSGLSYLCFSERTWEKILAAKLSWFSGY